MSYKRRKGKAIVKNKRLLFNGVTYKSGLEVTMAMLLHAEKIPFRYEPESMCLSEGFELNIKFFERQANGKGVMKEKKKQKVRSINYTIDFVGEHFFIETKGYANETFSIRWKLFKKWLVENNYDPSKYVVYKPQSKADCIKTVKHIKEHRTKLSLF